MHLRGWDGQADPWGFLAPQSSWNTEPLQVSWVTLSQQKKKQLRKILCLQYLLSSWTHTEMYMCIYIHTHRVWGRGGSSFGKSTCLASMRSCVGILRIRGRVVCLCKPSSDKMKCGDRWDPWKLWASQSKQHGKFLASKTLCQTSVNKHLRWFSDVNTHTILLHLQECLYTHMCTHKKYKIQRWSFLFETGSHYACIPDLPIDQVGLHMPLASECWG